jgi:predicted  nucleic acid-binding Zn-ribbon protein
MNLRGDPHSPVADDTSEELGGGVLVLLELALIDHEADQVHRSLDTLHELMVAAQSKLESIETMRHSVLERLPHGLAARHASLRRSKQYPYICAAVAGRCTGCDTGIPTALQRALVEGRLDACPTCQRLLFDHAMDR